MIVPALSPLHAVLDDDVARAAGWTVPALARACLAGGAGCLQVRAKSLASGALLEICDEVVAMARPAGAVVLVNDRADLARLSGASGVHLGQTDIPPAAARRLVGEQAVVGLSTHTLDQARAALVAPVDYVAIGPVFGTTTKATGYAAVGLELVGRVAAAAGPSKPVVAIGGVTLGRARSVLDAGASAVAVISDLLATGDPEARVREYLQALA